MFTSRLYVLALNFCCLAGTLRVPRKVLAYSAQPKLKNRGNNPPVAVMNNSEEMAFASAKALHLHPGLPEYCTFLYLDIGSNLGVQVRKLFESKKYPGSRVAPVFNKYFGDGNSRSKPSKESGICAVGFEANPEWEERLRTVEENHRQHGWHTQFIVPRVVSDVENKTITFWVDRGSNYKNWGASVNLAHTEKAAQKVADHAIALAVQSIDITAFLQSTVFSSKRSRVISKMDIEGSEYIVLPKMLREGLLCAGKIDFMYVEWHGEVPPGYEQGMKNSHQLTESLKKQIASGENCAGAAPTTLVTFDDEMYMQDKVPLDTTIA